LTHDISDAAALAWNRKLSQLPKWNLEPLHFAIKPPARKIGPEAVDYQISNGLFLNPDDIHMMLRERAREGFGYDADPQRLSWGPKGAHKHIPSTGFLLGIGGLRDFHLFEVFVCQGIEAANVSAPNDFVGRSSRTFREASGVPRQTRPNMRDHLTQGNGITLLTEFCFVNLQSRVMALDS